MPPGALQRRAPEITRETKDFSLWGCRPAGGRFEIVQSLESGCACTSCLVCLASFACFAYFSCFAHLSALTDFLTLLSLVSLLAFLMYLGPRSLTNFWGGRYKLHASLHRMFVLEISDI